MDFAYTVIKIFYIKKKFIHNYLLKAKEKEKVVLAKEKALV